MDKDLSRYFPIERVPVGALSAMLFILLDVFTVGILDIVLARVVCLAYYRNISEGKPVSVKSADIPGLSNYLLGRSLSVINIVAILTKIGLLAIVLVANITIDAVSFRTINESRQATFALSPSDAHIAQNYNYLVRRRPENMKTCMKVNDDQSITYYEIRFNLANDVVLDDTDYGSASDEEGMYDVDDSTVICMSPSKVANPKKLITVNGCTRINDSDTSPNSCLNVIQVKKNAPSDRFVENEEYDGDIKNMYRDYDQDVVDALFEEDGYEKPLFTCLSTKIGIAASGNAIDSDFTHCLLVSYLPRADETIVERWLLTRTDEDNVFEFTLEYPGIRFDGNYSIGRLASARYLQLPFPFTDYRTLSGELISQAADYRYLSSGDNNVGKLDALKVGETITIIPKYAIALVFGAVAAVIVALLVTVFLLWRDKRPRFNTINGLSSIVREEHSPSGQSYVAGESALLGLKFTRDDRLRFGPLQNEDEATKFVDGYDNS